MSFDRDAIRQKALHQITSTPYTDGPGKSVVSRRSGKYASPLRLLKRSGQPIGDKGKISSLTSLFQLTVLFTSWVIKTATLCSVLFSSSREGMYAFPPSGVRQWAW
jgi:hypothetical protein